MIFEILRNIARVRRRIFGKATPIGSRMVSHSWVYQYPRLIANITRHNISTWPLLSPVSQYVSNKRTWFKRPLPFFTSGLTLLITFLFIFAGDALKGVNVIDKTVAARYLAALCLSVPLLIPITCLFLRILFFMVSVVPSLSIPEPLRSNLLIPLSPWTYARLHYGNFLWSIFYYGIYFYLAIQILQIIGFCEFEIFKFISSRPDECTALATVGGRVIESPALDECRRFAAVRTEHQSMLPQYIMSMCLLGLFRIIGYFALINPYIELLRACVRIPTKRMHRADCYDLSELISDFTSNAYKRRWDRISPRLDYLSKLISTFENTFAVTDRAAREGAPKYFEKLQRERSAVLRKMLSTDDLRAYLKSGAAPDGLRLRLSSLLNRIDHLGLSVPASPPLFLRNSVIPIFTFKSARWK